MDAIEYVDSDDICQEFLVELCRGRCSEELVVTYRKILKTFFEINYTAHVRELESLYMSVNDQNVATDDVVSCIDDILRMAGDRALTMLQISLDPDTPIDIYAEIIDILLNFDPTDTPQILLNAINVTEDATESLCQLLEYLGTYEGETYYQYVQTVGGDFTPNLKKLLQDAANARSEDLTPISDLDQQRRVARLVAQKGETLGAELGRIHSGTDASLESLYGVYVGTLLDGSMESAIDHLYSLAALSCASFESAEQGVGSCLDDLYYDVDNRRRAEQVRMKVAAGYRTIFGDHHG